MVDTVFFFPAAPCVVWKYGIPTFLHSVDGRHPATVDLENLAKRFYISELVPDLFQQFSYFDWFQDTFVSR